MLRHLLLTEAGHSHLWEMNTLAIDGDKRQAQRLLLGEVVGLRPSCLKFVLWATSRMESKLGRKEAQIRMSVSA